MTIRYIWSLLVLLAVLAALGGCARAARDTTGFSITDTATVNAPFSDAWQMAKAVLREKGYDLYTRDKRGVFVAFTGQHHSLLRLNRTKYTVSLHPASDSATEVTIESVRQVYGTTLLTYPGWHDRKATRHEEAQELLKAIQAKAGEAPSTPGKS
jgi:hypothetical protein